MSVISEKAGHVFPFFSFSIFVFMCASMCMCVHVLHVYVCMYVCMYVYEVHSYICMCVVHAYMSTSLHLRGHMCVHGGACMCLNVVHVYICIFASLCVYLCVYTCVHVHVEA